MHSKAQGDFSEDCTVQNALAPVQDRVPKTPTCCTYYHKPIFILVFGGLSLGAGFIFLLHRFSVLILNKNATLLEVTHDGFDVGPLCLSVGLVFVVLGAVLMSITKQKVKCKERKMRARARMG